MKDKKVIAYKNELSKKIAYNLRKLLRKVVMEEFNRLTEEKSEKGKSQMERIRLNDEQNDLYKALGASICECASCNQTDRDMMYNAYLEEWYYTYCVQEYRDYYHEERTLLDKENIEFYESFL
ncbi:MAG: hypothetical protein ACTSPN_04605 [Promethearchaeota archaeon]